MKNLSDFVHDEANNLDTSCKIVILRTCANTAVARAIGAIRQHLKKEERRVRDESSDRSSLDERNERDLLEKAEEHVNSYFGFNTELTPLNQAQIFASVYTELQIDLKQMSFNEWSHPISFNGMYDLMVRESPPLDMTMVKLLAETAGLGIEEVKTFHEVTEKAERDKLIELRPAISSLFNGMAVAGEDSFIELPVLIQHQMAVKAIEKLGDERLRLISQMLRTRKAVNLANITFNKDGAGKLAGWVRGVEAAHSSEFNNAIEEGRNIRVLEDVMSLIPA